MYITKCKKNTEKLTCVCTFKAVIQIRNSENGIKLEPKQLNFSNKINERLSVLRLGAIRLIFQICVFHTGVCI